MKRLWFKKGNWESVLSGKKTMTTRDHPLTTGEYAAVCGSRFKARQFAIIRITSCRPIKGIEYSLRHWKEEGFDSRKQMMDWAVKNNLYNLYANAPQLFANRFALVEKL